MRYSTATLVDLVVLGLFAEYWERVPQARSRSCCSPPAVAGLLKLTIALEHRLPAFFNARPGGFAKFMRYFTAWLVLFGRVRHSRSARPRLR